MNTMSKEKFQYNNIDLFKIIFAVVVVMIHTTPFIDISESASWYFSNTVANLAVPFFFVTSGFLLFRKLLTCEADNRSKIVKKYLMHILRMYMIWCAIWIPWKALHYYNIGHFTALDLLKYIRNIFLVSGGDALWYLPALFASVSTMYFLKFKLNASTATITGLSLALYTFGCAISSWYGVFENSILVNTYYTIFETVDNGILNGMIFVSVGMIIAENENRQSVFYNISGFILSLSLLFAESYIVNVSNLNKSGVCNNFLLPVVIFFMFKLILSIKIEGKESMFKTFRDFSTLIYLSHCFIIRTIKLLASITDITLSHTVLFIITLLLSSVFAASIRELSKKYAWCRLLY